jgi:TPR repeat protein
MYSLTYKVTTSTCDSEGKLKLYSALQMMQDCSEMWIDSEPEVKDYFLQQNMAQLLATRQVEVIRVPDYKEELTVTTSVYGMKPMFGFRNTFIYDAQGTEQDHHKAYFWYREAAFQGYQPAIDYCKEHGYKWY